MRGIRQGMVGTVVLVGLLMITAPATGAAYKIGVLPWAGCAPAHVAAEKGFWAAEGVEVQVFTLPNGPAVQNAMEKGLLHVGFEMIGGVAMLARRDAAVTVLAETGWSHGGDKIIIREGIGPDEIRSKPVGLYHQHPSVIFFLQKYLDGRGISAADLRLVEMVTDALSDKFIDGVLDVIVNYDPDAARAVKAGNGRVAATSADYPGCIPEGLLIMNRVRDVIPEADLVNILRGWVRAAEWIADPENRAAYLKILGERTFKGELPEAELPDMAGAVRLHDPATLAKRNREGGGLSEYLAELSGFLGTTRTWGNVSLDPGAVFDNRWIMEAIGSR